MEPVATTGGIAVQPPTASLKYTAHIVVGIAIALIAPFTALAWPFALLVGMVIGKADAARMRGERSPAGESFVQGLAVTGGVLAMLFLGAIIGGLIAFAVVALASSRNGPRPTRRRRIAASPDPPVRRPGAHLDRAPRPRREHGHPHRVLRD